MANHPIALERVLFTRSIVVAIQAHAEHDGKINALPENQIDVTPIEGQPRKYVAVMSTKLNTEGDAGAPYMIDMECIGFFITDDTLTEDEARRGVLITAHNVLYGAIREAVAWLTGRQPHGTLVLGLSVLQTKKPEEKETTL